MTGTLHLRLSVASMKTCSNQIEKSGKKSIQSRALAPAKSAIANKRAMSGGATAPTYMERTAESARATENFTPENQFFVLHSHISLKFLNMRVLTKRGAYSNANDAPVLLSLSASRMCFITSFRNPL